MGEGVGEVIRDTVEGVAEREGGERGWEVVAMHWVVVAVTKGEVRNREGKERGGEVGNGFFALVAKFGGRVDFALLCGRPPSKSKSTGYMHKRSTKYFTES